MRTMLRFLFPVMLLGVAAGFSSCASFYRETVRAPASAEKIDTRNFAIDTCFPNANEKELAQAKAIAFWQKHALRFGPEPRYLAVETAKVFPSEVQDLPAKLYRWIRETGRQTWREALSFTTRFLSVVIISSLMAVF